MKPRYYDWNSTFTRGSADIVMVVGARGYGKTYGLRKQFIKDALKGFRFVEIVRHKSQLKGDDAIQHGYFEKLLEDEDIKALNIMLKTQGVRAYMADIPEEGSKPEWRCIGYFVAITEAQAIKTRTFKGVKRILLDEAILERDNPYKRYIPNEWQKVASIIDTVSRERADDSSLKPTLYLLGNAVDITNPYFAAFGITREPKEGYSWHRGKTVLVHYIQDAEYSRGKLAGTVAGRMLSGLTGALENVENRFSTVDSGAIARKTANAKLQFVIAYAGKRYGVWLDLSEGYYYITSNAPSSSDVQTFALTNSDMKPNYVMIQAVRKQLQGLADLYYLGIIRYDNEQTMQAFLKVLSTVGVRI